MKQRIRTLRDVVEWGLCTGCGACAAMLPEGTVELVNIESEGIRPIFSDPDATMPLVARCPGVTIDGDLAAGNDLPIVDEDFGPAHSLWVGYAADPDIRRRSSSGGIISALAVYCLEHENMAFAVHAGMDEDRPWLSRTLTSENRAQILERCGSRYAPASPAEGLRDIAESDRPCVFIGKPCDTTAAFLQRGHDAKLDTNLGLVVSLVCAGAPSTRGTMHMLEKLGIDREQVGTLSYRGDGWPGGFTVCGDTGEQTAFSPYAESWGELNHFRPFRCQLCPDGIGRVADITCGDAWHRYEQDGGPGTSVVIVRTRRGQEILERAIRNGYLTLEPATSDDIRAAQKGLLKKRRVVWGRLAAMKLLRTPAPRITGYRLFESWRRQGPVDQLKSIAGTVKRILKRGLNRRRTIEQRMRDTNET